MGGWTLTLQYQAFFGDQVLNCSVQLVDTPLLWCMQAGPDARTTAVENEDQLIATHPVMLPLT